MRATKRARYAAPVVLTFAAATGCGASEEPVNPPHEPHRNPPAIPDPTTPPATPATATAIPVATGPIDELPPPSGRGRVVQRPDGKCYEEPDLSNFKCPPKATCNPPPPMPVRCPPKSK